MGHQEIDDVWTFKVTYLWRPDVTIHRIRAYSQMIALINLAHQLKPGEFATIEVAAFDPQEDYEL